MRDLKHVDKAEPVDDDDAHTIDFEETDFAGARAALEEPPSGVKITPRAKPDWDKARRPTDERDTGLSAQAQRWIERMPPEIHPTELCTRYPRLANQLAEVWSNAALCIQQLDDLLVDSRGARRGFPSRIALELVMLRDHRFAIERRGRV